MIGPVLSVDALRGLALSQAVTANNLANSGSSGFRPSRVLLESGAGGQGVRVQEVRQETNGFSPVPDGPEMQPVAVLPAAAGSAGSTDAARETVRMILDSRAYEANAAMVRTSWENTGRLLDLVI